MRCGLAMRAGEIGREALGPAKLADVGGGDGEGGGEEAEARVGLRRGPRPSGRAGSESAVGCLVPEGAVLGAFAALDRDHAVDQVADEAGLDGGGGEDEGRGTGAMPDHCAESA